MPCPAALISPTVSLSACRPFDTVPTSNCRSKSFELRLKFSALGIVERHGRFHVRLIDALVTLVEDDKLLQNRARRFDPSLAQHEHQKIKKDFIDASLERLFKQACLGVRCDLRR